MSKIIKAIASVVVTIGAFLINPAFGYLLLATTFVVGVSQIIAKRGNVGSAGGDGGGRIQLPPATENKIPVIYGTAFTGGPVVDAMLSADQKTMWYVVALAEHTDTTAGSGYTFDTSNCYYDGKKIQFGINGAVTGLITNTSVPQTDTRVNGFLDIYLFTNGSSSGVNTGGLTAQQILSTANGVPAQHAWNANKLMSNCAFAIVKVKYSTDAGTTGVGALMVKITNTINKPGDAILDYMLNTRYGCAIPLTSIDTASLTALNTYSDELIDYIPADGNTTPPLPQQARYRVNGPLNTGENCLTNLQVLVDSCDSWLQYSELTGKWRVIINKLYTGYPSTSGLFLIDSSNLVGGIDISPINLNETYNQIEVAYPNTNIKDQTDYQIIDLFTLQPNILSANEAVNRLNINLPVVNNAVQAKYLAQRRLFQSREDLVIAFKTDFSGIQIEAGDVIRVTHPVYGWTDKLFRVINVAEEKDSAGNLFATIQAFEYSDQIYNDVVQDYIPVFNTGLKDPNVIDPPGTPTVTDNPVSDGQVKSFDVVSYVPESGLVLYMDFNYGNNSNVQDHRLYRTVQQSNGAPYINSNIAGNIYTNVNVNVNDLPAGNYYWSVTARNNGSGKRSNSSTVFAWTGANLNSNSVPGNTIQANTLNGNAIIGNTLNGNTLIGNTVNGNVIIGNTVNGNVIIGNTLNGNTIIANTINGNAFIANTINGNTIIANTLNGNTIIANTLNGNTVIANTMNGNVFIANTLNGNTIIANTVNGNVIIANTLDGGTIIGNTILGNKIVANSIEANQIQSNAITSDKIQANAITTVKIAANTVTTEQLIIGSVTQAKSSESGTSAQPYPFTNVSNAWPNNTRVIVPSGGVTIVPQTDPSQSANTLYQEGSRIQVGFTVQLYVDPVGANAYDNYNLIELWKSGASDIFDKGVNTVRHSYNDATYGRTQTIHAYGFGAYDLYSSDGGNTWGTFSNIAATSATITGAVNYGANVNLSGLSTYNVGYLQDTFGNGSVYCAGQRSGNTGSASALDLNENLPILSSTNLQLDMTALEQAPGTGLNGAGANSELLGTAENGVIFWTPTGTFGTTADTTEGVSGLLKNYYSIFANDANGSSYTAIAVGQTGTVVRSTRTLNTSGTWSAKSMYVDGNVSQPVLTDIYGVAGDNSTQSSTSKWVAVGQYGMIQVSTDDGDNWTQVTSPVLTNLNAIRYGNGTWVIVGDQGVVIKNSGNIQLANNWIQVDTSNVQYANGSSYGNLAGRNLLSIDYSSTYDKFNIGGQGILLRSDSGNIVPKVTYEDTASETYDLTRMTFFGSWPNVANTSRPPAEQRVVNNQVFSYTVIDTNYVQGQETTYYLVVGNMAGRQVYISQAYLSVQEYKR